MKLNLGSIQIPINAATKTFALLAKRGAGKSYAAAVMAEEFFKNNIPFVVFDPIDVWWGLRLDKNGKDKGLPVVVFGIKHADIPLDRDMGRKIAQSIVKENVSCVISTLGMPKVAQRYLISEFAEEILNINNTPRHIFIEEAHEYVPQKVFGGLGKTFNSVSNLVVMGRNQGLGVTLINQRAATINKDVLTQTDAIIALRSVGPQDKKALGDYASFHGVEDDPKFDQFINSLPSLPTGEGWIWSPEFLGKFEKIKIKKRETFHPDREKIGDKFVMPQLDQIDVQSFISKFSATLKDKKEEAKFKIKETETTDEPNPIQPIIDQQSIILMKNEYESQLLQKDLEIRKREEIIEQVRYLVGSAPIGQPAFASSSKNDVLIENLPPYEKAIMEAIRKHPGIPFTRAQLAIKSGKSYTSSAYLSAVAKLIKLNLIQKNGNDLIYKP